MSTSNWTVDGFNVSRDARSTHAASYANGNAKIQAAWHLYTRVDVLWDNVYQDPLENLYKSHALATFTSGGHQPQALWLQHERLAGRGPNPQNASRPAVSYPTSRELVLRAL